MTKKCQSIFIDKPFIENGFVKKLTVFPYFLYCGYFHDYLEKYWEVFTPDSLRTFFPPKKILSLCSKSQI